MPRRFILKATEKGKVYIADGIQLNTLQCIILWRAKHTRPTLLGNMEDVLAIHNCIESDIKWSYA